MEEFNRKRGVVKAQLTRLLTFVESVALDDVSKPEILSQLNARFSKLELIWRTFDEIQCRIEEIQVDDERAIFEESYFNCEAKFCQMLDKCKIAQKQANESQPIIDANVNGSFTATKIANIRLPTIDIPAFDGSLTDWLNFKSTFEGVIHGNRQISDTQKFIYLKSALKGEAITVIQGLEPSDANYAIAWDLLNSRFDNKQALINHHIKIIMEIPQMTRETLSDLRNMHNIAVRNIKSLLALSEDVKHWDMILIHILANKLDNWGRKDWEKEAVTHDLPTLDIFLKFILNKCVILQNSDNNKNNANISNATKRFDKPANNKPNVHRSFAVQRVDSCLLCSQGHALYQCPRFKDMTIKDRLNVVKNNKICSNCLRGPHTLDACRFGNCRLCNQKHNSLLHQQVQTNKLQKPADQVRLNENMHPQPSTSNADATYSVNIAKHLTQEVFLSTVTVNIKNNQGIFITARALLDCGSQVSLISEALVRRANLQTKEINTAIIGINQVVSKIKYATNIQITSRHQNQTLGVHCLVVPKVSDSVPNLDCNNWEIPTTISLADPEFALGGDIDVLLGADVFWKIIKYGQIELPNSVLLQNTVFGWIIAGAMNLSNYHQNYRCNLAKATQHSLDETLTRFWKLEEVPQLERALSADEQYCENYFMQSHTRGDNGQFIVRIPFNEQVNSLGNSHNIAINRFCSLERRFMNNPKLKEEYSNFICQYQQMGHMKLLTNHIPSYDSGFYLPHHAVYKDNKIRVVFDGSAKTDTGISLNDAQFTGQIEESDIFKILIRFRTYQYAFTTDIVKMFRMIKIADEDQIYQRIIWRDHANAPFSYYQLTTVTYGTRSAPHLATRALKQLAIDNQDTYPDVSKLLLDNKYVDDILGGSNSLDDVYMLIQRLTTVLSSAGFKLDKWSTNFDNNDNNKVLSADNDNDKKILGVSWNTREDVLQYFSVITNSSSITKRNILSIIARCYDPLGLLAPLIVAGKIILQLLWKLRLGWDESVPADIHQRYQNFCEQLTFSRNFKIPRHIFINDYTHVELHGFADASTLAYGACIYIKSVDANEKCNISLLCARSKVAPIQNVTIPRLELCAALMLAKLVNTVENILMINLNKKVLWTDSTITLHWIRNSPDRWKSFVSNRVSKIQSLTDIESWKHVRSKDNPADLISRGDFINNSNQEFWFQGPKWLKESVDKWPSQNIEFTSEIPERKLKVQTVGQIKPFQLFFKYSSLTKLQRVFGYVLRFIHNIKSKTRKIGFLSCAELNISLNSLIRIAQAEHFLDEIKILKLGQQVNTKSHLLKLNPFLDEENILRVGGRLSQSIFNFDKKHPIILPKAHSLTLLIIQQEHIRLMHAGPTLLLSSLRERFWPLGGRNACRSIVNKCVTCFKCSPHNIQPVMGQLPRDRVSSNFPFYKVGIDYAGPFEIKDRKLRFSKIVKSYVCVFVCLATKAIHLELASSLSTDEFLSCFRRFISRRGRPSCVYSDNGTNFVGASAEIVNVIEFLKTSANAFQIELAKDNIQWKFNPPAAPNFGGLWEAAVKSFKYHLKRIVKHVTFTYEEFYTVIVQIEGILNSRPLTPLSTDPSENLALTPAHFLIGRSITALPEHDLLEIKMNRLNNYQHVQQCIQHFWKRWSSEYVSSLQSTPKWNKSKGKQIQIGDMVLIHDHQAPPYCWPLGRIQNLHPGNDGIDRVATVRTSRGIQKRPISKLFPLPQDVDCINAGQDVRANMETKEGTAAPCQLIRHAATTQPTALPLPQAVAVQP